MTSSYQNEIPKARVNITLNLETNGSQKKTELPLKLLVMGKFNDKADHANFYSDKKIQVTKGNLDEVMSELSPSLSMVVPNHLSKKNDELPVRLTFHQYKDFHPEQIVNQIPELKRLLAMRNLLKELKSNVVDNQQLKHELEKIIRHRRNLRVEQ